jgi:hexosaminidase
MSPGQAYYLDMAAGREWELPGSSWAGNVPLETTCDFDPLAAWSTSATGRLLGVQACIWGEHITDLAVLDALTVPRLDAIAERGWTGMIVGGPDHLRHRAANLPRFSPAP